MDGLGFGWIGRARPGSGTGETDGGGGVCSTVEEGRGAGDFEPGDTTQPVVRGVIGRMMMGFGEWESGRGTGSALGFVENVSEGVAGLDGATPVGVLMVRCLKAP